MLCDNVKCVRSALAAGFLLFGALPVFAADYTLIPKITVSEEYTDNVFETNSGKRTDFITRLMPGFDLTYKAPLWDWNLGYNLDYRYYAQNSRSADTTHNLGVKGLITVVDNLLFLEISDTYKRVSLDVTRDTTNESLFQNQSDQNIFSVSPFFLFHPTNLTTLRTGYRYANTWYKDNRGINKDQHDVFADLGYEISPNLTANVGYIFSRIDSTTGEYDQHNSYVGARYEYAAKSFVFGQVGMNAYDYLRGNSFNSLFWNVGATHAFDTSVASFTTGTKTTEDPLGVGLQETSYNGSYTMNLTRGSAGLSLGYSEYTNTSSDSLTNRKLSGGVKGKYELLPDLTGNLGFSAEKYDNLPLDTYTRKYFIDAGLSYALPKDLSVGMYYKYVDYYSPRIIADNKVINRVGVELRKVF